MRFTHTFETAPSESTYFAFTYPFSYTDCQEMLDKYEKLYSNNTKIYFNRELIAESLEGRRIDLITITKKDRDVKTYEDIIPGLLLKNDSRPLKFNKPVIFVIARVHPAETQGSHMLNGLLSFLLGEYL